MTPSEMAKKIAADATGSGMRADRFFDLLCRALHHAMALVAPVSAQQIDAHRRGAAECAAQFSAVGIATTVADLLVEMEEAVGEARGDFLGDVAAHISSLDGSLGQFFTPFEISRLMAFLNATDDEIREQIETHGYVSTHEPAAGSGGLVLAFAEHLESLGYCPAQVMIADCTELEPSAFHMLYAQLSCRRIPAICRRGNTLTGRVDEVLYTPAYVQVFLPYQRLGRVIAAAA